MGTKSWPYGLKKTITVEAVVDRGGLVGVVGTEPATGQGWVLLYDAGSVQVSAGQTRTITCVPGGPTGQHWRLDPL